MTQLTQVKLKNKLRNVIHNGFIQHAFSVNIGNHMHYMSLVVFKILHI